MAKKKRKLPHIRLKLVTWIALWLMAFLLPLAWRRVSQPQQTEAAWWNDAWHYRQRVDVTNNTSEEANVYIALTLDTSDTTKFQANCGDLRFTKQNGQLLQYYLVSGCGTASTSIHVQFDAFPAGAQSIYAYYGNAAAADGFASADFSTEASDYTIGGVASEEVGPGPVAYWKFDEGSGSTAFDSASYGTGDELLTDGDMEAPGTSAWTAGNSATLTKQTSSPHGGSTVLRVAYSSSFSPYAYENGVTIGHRYRVHGFARGDGTFAPDIKTSTGATLWTGTSSTEWQEFDIEATADGTYFRLSSRCISSGYVEFDDVSIREITGNNGTITGATWASEDQCVRGKCLSFDGTDDYIASSDPGVTGTGAMSVSAWFRTTDTGSSDNTIIQWGTLADGELFELNVESGVVWSRNFYNTIQAGSGYNDDQWHHLVLTKTADSTVAGISIYVDGQELETTTSGSDILNFGNSYPIRIGDANHDSRHFNGFLDEVKIFPYALTEDQIKTEYNLGSATIVGEAATVAPPPNGTLKDSLVAHWSFDEQAGQTVHDKVGGNDGTRGADANAGNDDPTWKPASECKVNGCAGFDGTDDSVAVDFSGTSGSYSQLSVSAWVKWNSDGKSTIINEQGSDSLWFTIDKTGLDRLNAYLGDTSNKGYHSSTDAIPKNEWTHVVLSYNGATGTGTFYINGESSGTFTTSGALDLDSSITIGARETGGVDYFNGLIDEVKIYNTALTADQIKQDMNAGAAIVYGVTANEADELSDGAGDPPIAEWKFDEKQGTTAYDTSGNENDGTVNGATWKSACKQGACLEFDGDGDYVEPPDFTPGSHGYTFALWFKPEDANSFEGLVGKLREGMTRYGFGILSDNGVLHAMASSNNTEWYDNLTYDYSNSLNQWHHVAFTITGTSGTQVGRLYFDGANVATHTGIAGYYSYPFRIGGGGVWSVDQLIPGAFFNGQIDHVKIYDYARTPAQIAYDYNRGKPIAHWKFDECEGTVAHDSSGNDNHGTINIGASGSQISAGTCQTSGAWGNGAEGKFNGSLNFDGTDDYVEVADPPDGILDFGTSDFTSSAWIKTTANDKAVVGKDVANLPRWYGPYVFDNSIRCYVSDNTNTYYATATTPVNDGEWHHTTCVFDKDAQVRIFIDGREETITQVGSIVSVGSLSNNYAIKVGVDDRLGGRYFPGQIDDVRIYNYALSAAQVQKVMNEGRAVRYGPVLGGQ